MPRSPARSILETMTLDPQLSAVAAAVIAGYLMTVAGVHKRGLRWRNPPRPCPSCRHEQRDCVCRGRSRAGRHRPHPWILR